MKNNKKIIGLIGGMGPFASAEFCRLLLEKSVRNFGAKECDDFPEILLDSIPVPEFISDTKRLPIVRDMLTSRVKKLNKFGCTSIAIVCNTGHILFPTLSKVSKAKMVSIIDTVRDKVVLSKFKRVGLLATKTTIRSGLFKTTFANTGVTIVNPDMSTIEVCEEAIRGVIANRKSEQLTNKLLKVTNTFVRTECLDAVILGCTELPLAFPKDRPKNTIDCLDVLSDKLLEDYFNKK